MAKITVNELNTRIDSLEERVNTIDSKLDAILAAINGTEKPKASKGKASNGAKGTVKHSKKATQCSVTVVDGQGKGEGKKFINVEFDGKPSDTVLVALKGNGFRYFAPTKVWSTKYSTKAMKVAEGLIK